MPSTDTRIKTTISEISNGEIKIVNWNEDINVKVDERIDVNELIKDDPDPMFVNVEVLRNGASINSREYTADAVMEVVDMIPGTLGYLGHPDPAKTSFEFRDPQCIYVGSEAIKDEYSNIVRAIGKAYIFKTSPLREWIPKSIACGSPLTVSIHGTADVAVDRANNIIHVVSVNKLQCIDWCNPGTQGMPWSEALSVVSEMKNNKEEIAMERSEVLQTVTISELKQNNIGVVNQVLQTATISELQSVNPQLVEEIKATATISEMKLTVDGEEKSVKLDDVQGIIAEKEAKISEMQEAQRNMENEALKDRLISEMVDEQYRDKIRSRITGTDENSIKASIESEVAYISEMIGSNPHDNPPVGKQQRLGGDNQIMQQVQELFGVKTK